MKRDIATLTGKTFDVVVIGGGIHGATTACFAANCGLSVALVEKGDFSGSTSANSLKIIHGGLRYLQHFDIPRIMDSIASRRWMLANFPYIVRPLPCLMPTSGRGTRSRAAMAVGLAANDLLSCKRNAGVLPRNWLGKGRVISRAACAAHIPLLDMARVSGAALWYDALAVNTERVVLEQIVQLSSCGGQAINYCTVNKILQHQGKACGVLCTDNESKETFEIAGRCVINACGPEIGQFAEIQPTILGECRQWSRAVNIIVKRQLFAEHGIGLEGSSSFVDKDSMLRQGKRLFFFVPWKGKTMIGTVYSVHKDPAEKPVVTRETLEEFLAEVNRVYPAAGLLFTDVVDYHVGLVPCLPEEANGSPFDVRLDKRELVVDHGNTGELKNLLSIKTVKYTTAYTLACKVITYLEAIGIAKPGNRTGRMGEDHLPKTERNSLDSPIPTYLFDRYGRQAVEVMPYLSSNGLADKGLTEEFIDQGEVRYAVDQEMALHLGDVLFRRAGIAAGGIPSDAAITLCADLMADLLGWDQEQKNNEIAAIHQHYAPLC